MSWLKKGKKIGRSPETLGRIVQAAGLSRVLQHMSQGPFGILSASKGDLQPQENAERTAELKEGLVASGYGFIDQMGVWEGIPEDSVFIPGIGKDEVWALARKYAQDAFIWGDGGKATLINTSSGAEDKVWEDAVDKWHFLGTGESAEPASAYTEMRGRRWQLTGAAVPEIVVEADVTKGFKVITTEDEALRYGGMRVKNKAFALVAMYDLDRDGQPYFFLWGANAPQPSPRFGFAIHDHGDVKSLRHNDKGHAMPLRMLAAYLPLARIS